MPFQPLFRLIERLDVSIFDEPKIDTHCHLLDPQGFPYADDVLYRPAGQEIEDQTYFEHVMACYGVQHALLVGPNSGYNLDNHCLLHALETGQGKFKGIVVLAPDTSEQALSDLKAQGVVGVAFNVALNGVAFYQNIGPLLQRLRKLEMWAQFQMTDDQLVELQPLIDLCSDRILIDHCGRPNLARGLAQAGFQELLALGRSGRAVVKISGEYKYSQQAYPFEDTRPYAEALVGAFGLQRCIWASDWPYLKAPYRLDYGPMLKRWETMFSKEERHMMMWRNPVELFGFANAKPD
jgi:predicted TIM-barrel fold metal-dependent hydrolase